MEAVNYYFALPFGKILLLNALVSVPINALTPLVIAISNAYPFLGEQYGYFVLSALFISMLFPPLIAVTANLTYYRRAREALGKTLSPCDGRKAGTRLAAVIIMDTVLAAVLSLGYLALFVNILGTAD